VRDRSAASLTNELGRTTVGIDDFFGDARTTLVQGALQTLAAGLDDDGIELIALDLRTVDLGRTGDVIQAVARARYELDLENATAPLRMAEAANDQYLAAITPELEDAAWRYRETDLWRELMVRRETLNIALPSGVRLTETLARDATA